MHIFYTGCYGCYTIAFLMRSGSSGRALVLSFLAFYKLMSEMIRNSCPPPGSNVSSSNSHRTVCRPGVRSVARVVKRPMFLNERRRSAIVPAVAFGDSRIAIIPIPVRSHPRRLVAIYHTTDATQPECLGSQAVHLDDAHPRFDLVLKARAGRVGKQVLLFRSIRMIPRMPAVHSRRHQRMLVAARTETLRIEAHICTFGNPSLSEA